MCGVKYHFTKPFDASAGKLLASADSPLAPEGRCGYTPGMDLREYLRRYYELDISADLAEAVDLMMRRLARRTPLPMVLVHQSPPTEDGTAARLFNRLQSEPDDKGFQECEACASKPGSPILCSDCRRRRAESWRRPSAE
jgi:hypothetical protein